MGRTAIETRVSGHNTGGVQRFLMAWLHDNEFSVTDLRADGTEKLYPIWGTSLKLRPKVGSLVAVSGKSSGAVVFEFVLQSTGNDTIVRVEAYASGASMFAGREYELSQTSFAVAGWPRKRGQGLLSKLQGSLQALSESR